MPDDTSVDPARLPGCNPVAASPDPLRALMRTRAGALCAAPYG